MAAKRGSGLLTMTRARLVVIAVTGLVAPLLLLLSIPRPEQSGSDAAAALASTVFDIELTTFEGDPVRLASYADGKPLVVNFFASWCGPCVREMPGFEAVHARRGGDVRFLGVNLQDSPEAAADLVRRAGVTYDVVRDEDGQLFRAVRGFSMPSTVFLDAAGGLVEVRGGELSQPALEERIDRLLQR